MTIFKRNFGSENFKLRVHVSKVNFSVEQATKAQREEWRCSSTLSFTSALDWVGCQRHSPAALPPGITRYLFCMRLGGPKDSMYGCGISRRRRDSIPGSPGP
jgi:hypothetical protein